VRIREPNFEVGDEFKEASYIDRAELLCLRMVRQRLVDAATFLTSKKETGLEGDYEEPHAELTFRRYLSSLVSHVRSHIDFEQLDEGEYEDEKSGED